MVKNNECDTIRQVVFLLSAIVRRIKECRVDKDANPRLYRNASEKCAESSAMETN